MCNLFNPLGIHARLQKMGGRSVIVDAVPNMARHSKTIQLQQQSPCTSSIFFVQAQAISTGNFADRFLHPHTPRELLHLRKHGFEACTKSAMAWAPRREMVPTSADSLWLPRVPQSKLSYTVEAEEGEVHIKSERRNSVSGSKYS